MNPIPQILALVGGDDHVTSVFEEAVEGLFRVQDYSSAADIPEDSLIVFDVTGDTGMEALEDAVHRREKRPVLIYGKPDLYTQWLALDPDEATPESVAIAIRYAVDTASLRGELRLAREDAAASAIERQRAEDRSSYEALHDTLTGLPNRLWLENRLTAEIARAARLNTRLAVFFLDLDGFKSVNEEFGHQAGDGVIREVAIRLSRRLDAGELFARFGGDEFLMVIPDIADTASLARHARALARALQRPITVREQEVRVTTSIGIAVYPHDGETTDTLLRNADTALYRAKERGRDTHQAYTQAMRNKGTNRLTLENDLRRGIEENQFELFYQPIVDISANRITGVESLIRWHHPKLGMIFPNEFIELAEETGLITPLSEWIVRTAALQSVAWEREGIKDLTVSINLSARHFLQQGLSERFKRIMRDTGASPRHIQFEVTETMAMEDIGRTVARLKEFKEIGFGTAIDDFGIGHSSLNYLKRLPVSTLKIDQSFVADCVHNAQDGAIVRAIIGLARSLDLKVVAEGVERKDQLAFLLAQDCDSAQGYLFSHALPAGEFATMVSGMGYTIDI